MSVQEIKRHNILLTARKRLAALQRKLSIEMQGEKGKEKSDLFFLPSSSYSSGDFSMIC